MNTQSLVRIGRPFEFRFSGVGFLSARRLDRDSYIMVQRK